MDCPWCGCGWLFTCINCRQAFTFAKAVVVDEPWEEIGRRHVQNRWGKPPEENEVPRWVDAMKELLAGIEPRKEYVYLDGQSAPMLLPSATPAGIPSMT
jgi:hypothetical protein